jgi:hypothetical protein
MGGRGTGDGGRGTGRVSENGVVVSTIGDGENDGAFLDQDCLLLIVTVIVGYLVCNFPSSLKNIVLVDARLAQFSLMVGMHLMRNEMKMCRCPPLPFPTGTNCIREDQNT